MGSSTKRIKGYIGSVLIVYTVLVTYFLAQTAWNTGVVETRRSLHQDAKVLDVLVQEERRHLRSFENVVQNYRQDVDLQLLHVRATRDKKNYIDQKSDMDRFSVRLDGRKMHNTLDNEVDNTENVSNSILEYKDPYALIDRRDAMKPKGVFVVEVEEIDQTLLQSNSKHSQKTPHFWHRKNTSKVANLDNTNQQLNTIDKLINQTIQNNSLVDSHNPSLKYCENFFENRSIDICKRDKVVFDNEKHVNLSIESLFFKRIGDVYIFSAYVDSRGSQVFISLMGMGSKYLTSNNSVYWCVFNSNDEHNSNQYLNRDSKRFSDRNPLEKISFQREASKLTFHTASNGHNQDMQLYIFSCLVPQNLSNEFITKSTNKIEIIVGGHSDPYLDTVHDRILVTAINNINVKLKNKTPNSENETNKRGKVSPVLNFENDTKIKRVYRKGHNQINETSSNQKSFSDSFVSCVAPLHKPITVLQLVEFIELTFLLGIQHIVFYTFRVYSEVKNVLSFYERKGLVTVIPWNIPEQSKIWSNGRDIALNDCLYRTMFLYKYSIFHDIDEFFIPRLTPDLPSLIKYLQYQNIFNPLKHSDIVLSSTYFAPPSKEELNTLSTSKGYTKDVSKFATLKSIHRTYFNSHHTMRILQSSKAFRVGAGERRKTSVSVNPKIAGVNHYSYCPKLRSNLKSVDKKELNNKINTNSSVLKEKIKKDGHNDLCLHTKVDWLLWRYKDMLINNTKTSIRALNRKN